MKKCLLLLLPVIVLLAASCNNEDANDAGVSKGLVEDTTHNAANSLDYTGVYEGELPCADCPGIDTRVTIEQDGTFSVLSTYKERNVAPFEEFGDWNIDGNIITFHQKGEVPPLKYFVGEGFIRQLDLEGKEITGALAEHYVLQKVK